MAKLQPKAEVGVFGKLSNMVGGGGGSSSGGGGGGGGGGEAAATAAAASPTQWAWATRKALRDIAQGLKKEHNDAQSAREGAEKSRKAAVEEGRRAQEELEVTGPKKVARAKAAAKKEGDALAAAEAKLAMVSEVGSSNFTSKV